MSPATFSASSVFQTISDEKLGFKFGEPDRPSDESLACILPLLRTTSAERQYITMPETEEVLINDSGTIHKVNLKNASKKNVFVRSGTIFEGKGTQTRALVRSAVLFPGSEVGLDVRCIHASHGIRTGAEFKYGGVTPMSVDSAFYTNGFTGRDQSTMWNAVQTASATMRTSEGNRNSVSHLSYVPPAEASIRSRIPRGATRAIRGPAMRPGTRTPMHPVGRRSLGASIPRTDSAFTAGTDNLKANFDQFAKNFDGLLSKARLHDDQVGLALITETGCKTIELFDVPVSWEALHKDAVKRMGTELLRGPDKTSVFQYRPENAIAAVKAVLGLDFKQNLIYEHKPSNGEPSVTIFGITAGRYVGEIVELDNRVVHLLVLESA